MKLEALQERKETVPFSRPLLSVPFSRPSLDPPGYQNRMRYKVRAAIYQWDLLPLYPDCRPETEGQEFRHTYEENADLERVSKEQGG